MSIDSFSKSLEQHIPDGRLSRQEAVEAHHNLSGFMSLLIKINEREQIVPTGPEGSNDADQ